LNVEWLEERHVLSGLISSWETQTLALWPVRMPEPYPQAQAAAALAGRTFSGYFNLGYRQTSNSEAATPGSPGPADLPADGNGADLTVGGRTGQDAGPENRDGDPVVTSGGMVSRGGLAVKPAGQVTLINPVRGNENEAGPPAEAPVPPAARVLAFINGRDHALFQEYLLAEQTNPGPAKSLVPNDLVEWSPAGTLPERGEGRVLWAEPLGGATANFSLGIHAPASQPLTYWVPAWTVDEPEVWLPGPEVPADLVLSPGPGAASQDPDGRPCEQLAPFAPEPSGEEGLGWQQPFAPGDDLGQEADGPGDQPVSAAWVAVLAGVAACAEAGRRRLRAGAGGLSLAARGADETLTWAAGLSGSYLPEEP
jgi:hypothetical protein